MVGIGRHACLKSMCPYGRGGSNPSRGTTSAGVIGMANMLRLKRSGGFPLAGSTPASRTTPHKEKHMEELAKAITELIRTGAPLGELAIRWYFIVQIMSLVQGAILVLSFLATACFIITRCHAYFRWLRTCKMQSCEKAGKPYRAPER